MGKKNYSDTNATIGEFIFNDYIDGLKNSHAPDVVSDLPLLIKNNLATTITSPSYMDSQYPSLYRTASKFIQKYNDTLKTYRRPLDPYEFGGSKSTMAEDHPKLIKLAKSGLEMGVYYAQLDKLNYCVLELTTSNNDSFMIDTKFSFIGEDWKHWKHKFDKFTDKYEKLMDDVKHETIRDIDTRDRQKVVFKPFEQLIFKDKDKVISYIDNWVKNIPVYYKKYNMIAKLSIILYGDPGTGKSTFAKALAKHLNINSITTVKPSHFMNSPNESSQSKRPMGTSYDGTVYCLDDIDCYCQSREDSHDKENGEVLANLLAFLDNPPTVYIRGNDGVRYPVSIVVATTNYFDKLDDAVKRYGRFDLRIHMPLFTKAEADEMCALYDLKLEDLVKGSDKKNFTISPSYLQALCLENVDKSMKKSD